MAYTLRDFVAGDFDTLFQIDQVCFADGIAYSRAELRAYMRRRGAFTLVGVGANPEARSRDPNIVGFIVAEAGPRARGHIITIDVIEEARRFGLGSLLLRGAEDRLLSAECRVMELETAVDNLSALAFYKRHGYNVIKSFPRYYSNGLDALVLEKVLA